MTRGERLHEQSPQDPGDDPTFESSDIVAPTERPKKSTQAKRRRNRQTSDRGQAEPGMDRPVSATRDEADGGFDIPVGDSGAVVRSAWRFGA